MLLVKDVMKLADFFSDAREDRNMQRKVLRRLPGKGKCCMKEALSGHGEVGSLLVMSINDEKGKNSDVSPLTSNSGKSWSTSDDSQRKKLQRLTVSQKQDQQADECAT